MAKDKPSIFSRIGRIFKRTDTAAEEREEQAPKKNILSRAFSRIFSKAVDPNYDETEIGGKELGSDKEALPKNARQMSSQMDEGRDDTRWRISRPFLSKENYADDAVTRALNAGKRLDNAAKITEQVDTKKNKAEKGTISRTAAAKVTEKEVKSAKANIKALDKAIEASEKEERGLQDKLNAMQKSSRTDHAEKAAAIRKKINSEQELRIRLTSIKGTLTEKMQKAEDAANQARLSSLGKSAANAADNKYIPKFIRKMLEKRHDEFLAKINAKTAERAQPQMHSQQGQQQYEHRQLQPSQHGYQQNPRMYQQASQQLAEVAGYNTKSEQYSAHRIPLDKMRGPLKHEPSYHNIQGLTVEKDASGKASFTCGKDFTGTITITGSDNRQNIYSFQNGVFNKEASSIGSTDRTIQVKTPTMDVTDGVEKDLRASTMATSLTNKYPPQRRQSSDLGPTSAPTGIGTKPPAQNRGSGRFSD